MKVQVNPYLIGALLFIREGDRIIAYKMTDVQSAQISTEQIPIETTFPGDTVRSFEVSSVRYEIIVSGSQLQVWVRDFKEEDGQLQVPETILPLLGG